MIAGIGIDAVEIERFEQFHKHPNLNRIFSPEEIVYCLKDPAKSAERFAARFAAKEALYKALTQALGKPPMPFLQLCSCTSVQRMPNPTIIINTEDINTLSYRILLSITHSKNIAFAQVLLQEKR